ncbi:Clathrin interactor 1 [Trichoplax sp. H2]|nr:Clathrin interactor 1 [Trichoplax sp. H2]|eukprot:RDD41966.1 Clathrin interactor 1 [Trichoplax sp. H2]
MHHLQKIQDKLTDVVMNYSEIEKKVKEATNDEKWGPHGSLMSELAKCTFTYEHYPELMSMLWRRMFNDKKIWRRTYKSLLLLAYLIRNGSDRVVNNAREHLYDLRNLENFQAFDEFGKDQGINVRQKVKEIINLLQDNERLRQERKNAKKTRDKYIGVSSNDSRWGSKSRYDTSDDYDFRKPRSGGRFEYKDESGDESGKETKDDSYSPPTSQSEKPAREKSKAKISLGAAANFGRTETSSASPPAASAATESSSTAAESSANGDFANFSAMRAKTSTGDEFSDFQSNVSSKTENNHGSGGDLLGDFSGLSVSQTSQSSMYNSAQIPQMQQSQQMFNAPQTASAQPMQAFGVMQQPQINQNLSQAGQPLMGQSTQPMQQPPMGQPSQQIQQPLMGQSSYGMQSSLMGQTSQPLQQPFMGQMSSSVQQPVTATSVQGFQQPMMGQQTSQFMQQPMQQQTGFAGPQPRQPIQSNSFQSMANRNKGKTDSQTNQNQDLSKTGTIWSNSSLDISLDGLKSSGQSKPQPSVSMNQMQQSNFTGFQGPQGSNFNPSMGSMGMIQPNMMSGGMMGQQQQVMGGNSMGGQGYGQRPYGYYGQQR